jgi:hypothetical protein
VKRYIRIAVVVGIFVLLVLLGRTDIVAFGAFVVDLFLPFFPTLVLLALTVIVAALVFRLFRRNKIVFGASIVFLSLQTLVLILWLISWTAASAFENHDVSVGQIVIDPRLEHLLMIVFWLLAAFVSALTIEHLINHFLSKRTEPKEKNYHIVRLGFVLLQSFLLLSIYSSMPNYRRQIGEVNVPNSSSPDAVREIQLVPMNALIDTNGIVIVRKPHALFWRTVGSVGDELTGAESGRFVWSPDSSRVYLLLNVGDRKDDPVLGYDFKEAKNVEPGEYRPQK